jgi:hypothetical protein
MTPGSVGFKAIPLVSGNLKNKSAVFFSGCGPGQPAAVQAPQSLKNLCEKRSDEESRKDLSSYNKDSNW